MSKELTSRFVLAVFTILSIAACARQKSGDVVDEDGNSIPHYPTASCDHRTVSGHVLEGQCRDWVSGNPSGDLQHSCNFMSGVFATTLCPASNRVGSCVLTPAGNTVTTYRYYSPQYNATTARSHCETVLTNGTFSP